MWYSGAVSWETFSLDCLIARAPREQHVIHSLCSCSRTSCIKLLTPVSNPILDLKLTHATMNASQTNMTSTCPTSITNVHNATGPYCALPLCANNTAVMAECCAGSQVYPYHSMKIPGPGEPNPGIDNATDLNALWCHVDNSSAHAWFECISSVESVGMCAPSSPGQKGSASQGVTAGLKTVVGLAVMVTIFHIMP